MSDPIQPCSKCGKDLFFKFHECEYKAYVYDDAIGHFINGEYQRCYDTKEGDHQEALVDLLNGYERQLSKREDDYRKLRERSDDQIENLERQLAEARDINKVLLECQGRDLSLLYGDLYIYRHDPKMHRILSIVIKQLKEKGNE